MRKNVNLLFSKLFQKTVGRNVVHGLILCNFLFVFILQARADYSFNPLDVPGAQAAWAAGINDAGQIVGGYYDTSWITRGFIYKEGTFTSLNVTGANGTQANGINNTGQIVGEYYAGTGTGQAFFYQDGTFTLIDFPGAFHTETNGINNAGQIVGYYIDANYYHHGFLYTGGTFTSLDVPGALHTQGYGINNAGQVVGLYFDANMVQHGFLYKDGTFTPIDFPGSFWVWPAGINDAGQIVGHCSDASGMTHGFLYSGGTVSYIDVPGGQDTRAAGINNAGQIVGLFYDANYMLHGFLATAQAPVILLDPVDTLIVPRGTGHGSLSVKGPSLASYTGRIVKGVSADGIAQVIVRIPANSVREKLTIFVVDENEHMGPVQDNGGLTRDLTFGESPGLAGLSTSRLTVSAEETKEGPMAFVVYSAPTNFVRNGSEDSAKSSRTVWLKVQSNIIPVYSSRVEVQVFRPPVVLVHGLWGSEGSWDSFNPFLTDLRFSITLVNYSKILPSVTAISPDYSGLNVTTNANALGLVYNAAIVEKQVRDYIKEFRAKKNLAAIQADLVAHSMGGVVSLSMGRSREFKSPLTYGLGPVHKLITIGTPYLGSPLASGLMKGNNCVRNRLAENGLVSFKQVTVNGIAISGAVHDLGGDGTGKNLSQALKALQGKPPFPYARIAGIENASNLQGLGCTFCMAFVLRALCGTIARNPIAQALTPQGWPGFFGQDSDGIVPLSSQLNGGTGTPFDGVIHTDAIKELSFKGPSELEYGGIQTKVIELLNAPNNDHDFQQ